MPSVAITGCAWLADGAPAGVQLAQASHVVACGAVGTAGAAGAGLVVQKSAGMPSGARGCVYACAGTANPASMAKRANQVTSRRRIARILRTIGRRGARGAGAAAPMG